ncbi:hypothetical protein H8S37_04415 [Mediterraneibacter sp. NSJ-55]|uniref:Uncharacterized protein n=1 Tax=Mediterraneibacter hominis TaxID=2763054 RepID=A0A923LG92_9FIRM|nr:hypothetical protein [Mediterraneibacter hominis]MBC5688177.1 hypothetical protein [Mediterraneibacter hominis]
MLKRNTIDQLYDIAIERVKEKNHQIVLNESQLDAIYYSIYGILQHEGEDAARKYVLHAEIRI